MGKVTVKIDHKKEEDLFYNWLDLEVIEWLDKKIFDQIFVRPSFSYLTAGVADWAANTSPSTFRLKTQER